MALLGLQLGFNSWNFVGVVVSVLILGFSNEISSAMEG